MTLFRTASLVSTFIFCAQTAFAQAVDPNIVIEHLGPGRDGPLVTALKKQNALVFDARQQIPASFDFGAMNVAVEFDGDGPLLTANGMLALRSVAAAMMDARLEGQTYQVGAHLWFGNTPGAAMPVSAQRAQAVVDHLTAYYDISPQRLVPVGYGGGKPVNPGVPGSPENTRIEFINISGL